jgi:hypothetical protein
VGVIAILLFQKKFFHKHTDTPAPVLEEQTKVDSVQA